MANFSTPGVVLVDCLPNSRFLSGSAVFPTFEKTNELLTSILSSTDSALPKLDAIRASSDQVILDLDVLTKVVREGFTDIQTTLSRISDAFLTSLDAFTSRLDTLDQSLKTSTLQVISNLDTFSSVAQSLLRDVSSDTQQILTSSGTTEDLLDKILAEVSEAATSPPRLDWTKSDFDLEYQIYLLDGQSFSGTSTAVYFIYSDETGIQNASSHVNTLYNSTRGLTLTDTSGQNTEYKLLLESLSNVEGYPSTQLAIPLIKGNYYPLYTRPSGFIYAGVIKVLDIIDH